MGFRAKELLSLKFIILTLCFFNIKTRIAEGDFLSNILDCGLHSHYRSQKCGMQYNTFCQLILS